MMMEKKRQDEVLSRLGSMADYLMATFEGLGFDQRVTRAPDGSFSPVEHCWHLADLEREGFAARIGRLLHEENPRLPDFDGDLAASQRDYRSRSLEDGIAAFREARRSNLEILNTITGETWRRQGVQEGVGDVTLSDIPLMMIEHDASHRGEIESWLRSVAPRQD